MNTAPARPSAWRSIPALVLALALAFAGLVAGATPARAATGDVATKPAPSVTVTRAPAAGGEVTVSGSGFATVDSPGVYVAIAPSGAAGFYQAAVDRAGMEYVPVSQLAQGSGSFALVLTAPAVGEYSVYVSMAHGKGASDRSQDAIVPVEYERAATPAVTVSKTQGLASGEVVTVRGTGFGDQSVRGARPPLAGKFAGVYVTFGSYADSWKPSEGIASSARKNHSQFWVVNPEDVATIGGAARGGVAINPDGSFEVQFTVEENFDGALPEGNYGIYTYAGAGTSHAPFETYTALSFADAPSIPTVAVSKTEGLVSGEVVTVRGTGFGDQSVVGTRPPLAGKFAGVYVTFGSFAEVWRPSEGAPSSARVIDRTGTRWFVNADDVSTIGGASAGGVAINPDGSFETEITVDAELKGALEHGRFGIYTYAGAGVKHAPFETYTPISFAGATPPTTPTTPTVPTTPPAPEPAPVAPVAAGSLTWGVKSAFRSYVTGPIARGSISVSGAASAGSAFVFGQAGGTFTAAAGAGTADYSGAVRFTGHGGALNLVFANPSVEVVSAQRGNLYVTVNGARVLVGTLNLAAASRTEANGAVTYNGVPATLTAAGANAFNGFYGSGEALDPISFTVGSPAAAPASAGTVVVASAPARTPARTPAPNPPATSGVELVSGEATAGGEVTITASGFQPNETGILIVVYSEPIVLDRNATADANGVVTWTGVLPVGLTGEHTLTVQGSVSRGIPITIEESLMRTTALDTCEVTNANLTWGFKEAFRSYVSGTIAKGEWTVADGATYETPNFGFTAQGGSYDAETGEGEVTFPGAITFTGHGGILATTVSNPRIEFIDEGSARLFLDVTGETRDGESVNQLGVHFADLDLSAATVDKTDEAVTLDGAPAVLTAAGSAAFGTYEPGTDLDPITVELTLAEGCGAPVAVEDDAAEAPAEQDEEAAGTDWLPWVIAGVLLLIVIALVIALLRRRAKE